MVSYICISKSPPTPVDLCQSVVVSLDDIEHAVQDGRSVVRFQRGEVIRCHVHEVTQRLEPAAKISELNHFPCKFGNRMS